MSIRGPLPPGVRISLRAIEAARVHHADVAEREIVLDRIVRIEPPQRRSYVDGHPPSGARVAREPEAATDADHVSIERDDQLRRRHARPDAEIECVAA